MLLAPAAVDRFRGTSIIQPAAKRGEEKNCRRHVSDDADALRMRFRVRRVRKRHAILTHALTSMTEQYKKEITRVPCNRLSD